MCLKECNKNVKTGFENGKEQLHKKLDDFLSGSNKEKVIRKLFSLLSVWMSAGKSPPPDKDRMWEQVAGR